MFTSRPSGLMPPLRSLLRAGVPLLPALLSPLCTNTPAHAQSAGEPVLPANALLTTAVGGLERTRASAQVVPVQGQAFTRALQVTIRADSPESNATQLTIPVQTTVQRGDVLLASFSVRGAAQSGKAPAQMMLLFERMTDPWTKSVSEGVSASVKPTAWRHYEIPFAAAESYSPGQAMVSLRFAFGPQTVEVGGLSVTNFGRSRRLDDMVAYAAAHNPLGDVRLTVRPRSVRQTLVGFGGNFCQPRYGSSEANDPVGRYNLAHLRVAHARVGIPLNSWTPAKGEYRDEGPAHAAMLLMQEMARRRIPIAGSVWEGPGWMLGGRPEQSGRTLPAALYGDCIEAIGRFLLTARDRYGATVDYFSFNEPDYGVNFRFTPAQMIAFIRQAGPRFKALGLKTRFLVGDTGGGGEFADYARPILEDRAIAPYLGPLSFHCWDVLGTPDARYAAIAALGRRFHKTVWCLEAGHDAQLWQAPDPWAGWDNGLHTALAYAKTLRLTDAAVMDYWTYQDNYPIVNKDGTRPYPVFQVIRQMQEAFPGGARIVEASIDRDELSVLASVGPGKGRVSVLLANPIGAGRTTLSGLPPGGQATIVRSTSTAQRVAAGRARVDAGGRLAVALPARSVVTITIAPR